MKKENSNGYIFDNNGNLMISEQGFPLNKPGIEYRNARGKSSMFRLESDNMTPVRRFVEDYIRNHKTGCWVCLPGGNLNIPMQVEFLFESKESHPELSDAYEFFKNLSRSDENFTYVRLLMEITREDALKFQLIEDASSPACLFNRYEIS